ncbi:aminoglycoside phosphotransferase family protein [Phytohabitans sp. ZYX-F-186]|uniref:Aminoglycoside phosphotransferase family protein n=1 Tax=Phytohabitans maris TaxID=3071409 RepID=A0ABU0ZUE8_9ACTN|nr:aminoglycoside phosphotransferase family protein [Phytohabitans sp. ZYX-F-186]MDQ7909800.1 aminoglycoside phosphotransferase family protein [Phytohabitans sp. ZYX-F-186]
MPRAGGEVTRVFEVRPDGPVDPVIVKVYPDRVRWRLAKEVYVYRLLARRGVTRVPRVLHVEPAGVPALQRAFAVMTLLPGGPLSTVVGELPAGDLDPVYGQMGRLLSTVHRIRFPSWGYIVTGIHDPRSTNSAYMAAEFAEKLERFADLGGDSALREAIAVYARGHADLFAACRVPVLCHNDFHEANVLVADTVLTGCVDVENAVAADPLLDIARTDYFSIRDSAAKRDAFLRGYGPLPPGWAERVAVYRLFHAVDHWNHSASAGNRAKLPYAVGDIETMLRGEPLGPWQAP